jgi:glycosyltransferase involved in cell wall biosynthesis
MRYAWDQFDAYFGPERMGRVGSAVMRPIMAAMARWDRATEGRVHRYLAISQYVARRIALYYNRQSTIVFPPVDTSFYTPGPVDEACSSAGGVLVVSALVPYKRVELAIGAAKRAGMRLTIVGDGPERPRLEAMADHHITFLGSRSNEEIRTLYRSAIATILPGEEDFGIVPVESQACGRPVVAPAVGGVLDTVVDDETGVLVDTMTEESLAGGLKRVASREWDAARIRQHAEAFGRDRFAREVMAVIDEAMAMAPGQRC